MVSWLSASKTGLHCSIIGTLGLIVAVAVVVAVVLVVLVVGGSLSSIVSGCTILHSRLIFCGCGSSCTGCRRCSCPSSSRTD